MEPLRKLLTQYIVLGIAFWSMASLPAYAIANWQRISTPHFDILFPPCLEREANRVANTLEHIYKPVGKSLNTYPKRITVILRNQIAVSNGFVTLAPLRTEFFTFSSQDYNFFHTNDWLNLLAIHEFRHVVQYELLNQGFNKFLYTLGGEQFLGIGTRLNIPAWVYEGDAVGTETALTKGGRGRIPYFGLLYKTNLLEKGGFSYQKQLFRSYKDFIPDHYKIGYYLTTHLRKKYGTQALANILTATTQPSFFHSAVEAVTGKSLLEIYQDTNQELKELWKKQLQGLKLTSLTRLNKRGPDPVYTDYSYPQLWGKDIIALKHGLDTSSQFISLDTQQKEHPLITPASIKEDAGFSIAQGKLVWIEDMPDLLWGARMGSTSVIYSAIQLYDLKNKKLKTLTPKSRYAVAALSPDGTKIVALETDQAYNHQLVILDSNQGKVLQRLPNPANHYYLTPKFSADGQSIVAIKQINGQATITIINLSTGKFQDILPHSAENIGWPVMAGNYVFYNSAYSGIDNIYALDLNTQKRYQVTSSKYGAYYAAILENEQAILYNDFTKDGMDIVKMPLDPEQWIPLEKVEIRRVDYYEPLVKQENNPDLLNNIPKHQYSVQPYQSAKHLINIHSWEPYINLSILNGKPEKKKNIAGLTIYSQNLLGTALWKASYKYNFTDRLSNFSTAFTYQGWYPILTIGGVLDNRYQYVDMGIKFPLTWQKGQYQHQLVFSTNGKIKHEAKHNHYIQTYEAHFIRSAPKSMKDITIPWKQDLTILYQHVPYDLKRNQLWCTKARINFPGLFKHHGLSLGAIYRYRLFHSLHSEADELLSSHAHKSSKQVINTQVYYTFPLSYPDWGLGLFCYFKRLKNKLFYEGSYSIDQATIVMPKHAFGTELIWECHLWSFPMPLELGIIAYYKTPSTKNSKFKRKPIIGKSPIPIFGFVLRYGK